MIRMQLYEDKAQKFSGDFEGTVVIGRADATRSDPAPFSQLKLDGNTSKVIFAHSHENAWSRKQVILEPIVGGLRIKVTNGSTDRRFVVEGGQVVQPGESYEVPLPTVVHLDSSKVVSLQAATAPGYLPNVTLPPPSRQSPPQLATLARVPIGFDKKEATEVIAWMNAAMDVLQAAVNSDDFFDRAAAAAVQMVDLDSARLLLYRGGDDWHTQAVKQAGLLSTAGALGHDRRVLDRVLAEKRTVWDVWNELEDGAGLNGVNAVIAAPVLDREGQVIGALYGERRRTMPAALPITEAEAMLVELLARGVAAGLARQQQELATVALQSELDIGRQIQRGFLPVALPQLPKWEIGSRFQPAKEVSGDFYDVFALSEQHVGLIIADVCNKGLGAALFMALFRSLIRAFSQQGIARDLTGTLVNPMGMTGAQGDRHLLTLLIEVNALTTVALTNNYVANMHGDACMFATLFFGVLDTTTGIVHYVNAGHDAPLHLGAGGVKGRLMPTGPSVGWAPDQNYTIETVALEPGDMLFCYTDGIIDSRSPGGKRFTENRLIEMLNQPFSSAAQVLELVESTVNAHAGELDPFDDIAMLAVYRSPATT